MLPAQIYTDPVRLRQILGNILSNALKFTDRGEVFVHAGFESSPDNPNVGEMRFYVRDTGIGIPQEKRDNLFKAFSQPTPPPTTSTAAPASASPPAASSPS
jgi:signal transduction histidine kinase